MPVAVVHRHDEELYTYFVAFPVSLSELLKRSRNLKIFPEGLFLS
jgi:hypothetical protein